MPKISVILCAYNSSEFLFDAVNSILNQTFKDIELIIVNDGSSDSTLSIASCFAHIDSRVRCINIENGGLSNARNVGIGEAKGEFIAFCDADDTIDNNAFEIMYSAALKDKTDMIISGYHHDTVAKSGRISTVDIFSRKALYGSKNDLYKDLVELKSKYILDPSWNKLYRLSIITNHNITMPLNELFEDTEFVLSFLDVSCRVTVLDDCFYHYVQRHNDSITKKYDSRKADDLTKRYLHLAKFCEQANDDVKNYCSLYHIRNMYSSIANSYGCKDLTPCMRKQLIRRLTINETFTNCARNAKGKGFSNKLTLIFAKANKTILNAFYCKSVYLVKKYAARVFTRLK